MAKVFFNTLYYLTIGTVGVLGLLLVGTLVPIPGNFEVKVVKSGSMEPTLPVGGIVVIKPAASYEVGDVITFGADTQTQIPTTHRIVGTEGTGAAKTFTTRGDANDAPDQTTVRPQDIHGKMVFGVPYVGYVLAFARTKLGFFLLVGVPALLVFFEEGKNIFQELKKMRVRRRRGKVPVAAAEYSKAVGADAPATRRSIEGVRRVIALVLGVGLMGAVAGVGGMYGDTVAYYADRAVSVSNALGASSNFGPELFMVTLSEPEVSISSSTPPEEEVPPGEEVPPPVDEQASSTESVIEPLPALEPEPPEEATPPEEPQSAGDSSAALPEQESLTTNDDTTMTEEEKKPETPPEVPPTEVAQ